MNVSDIGYASCSALFPCTLSVALTFMWDNVLKLNPVNLEEPNGICANIDGFKAWIALFVAANAIDNDRLELLKFILQST
jgi:hypothetical protein